MSTGTKRKIRNPDNWNAIMDPADVSHLNTTGLFDELTYLKE